MTLVTARYPCKYDCGAIFDKEDHQIHHEQDTCPIPTRTQDCNSLLASYVQGQMNIDGEEYPDGPTTRTFDMERLNKLNERVVDPREYPGHRYHGDYMRSRADGRGGSSNSRAGGSSNTTGGGHQPDYQNQIRGQKRTVDVISGEGESADNPTGGRPYYPYSIVGDGLSGKHSSGQGGEHSKRTNTSEGGVSGV